MKSLILATFVFFQVTAMAAEQAPAHTVKCIVKTYSKKLLAEASARIPNDAFKASANTPSLVLPLTAVYTVQDTDRYGQTLDLARTFQIDLVLSKSDERSRIIYGEVSLQRMEDRDSEKQILDLNDDGSFSAVFARLFSDKAIVKCQLFSVTP